MQYDIKTQRLIFLITLNIIVLVSVVVSSHFIYAQKTQTLHQKTLYDIIKHISSNHNSHIPVGKGPKSIGFNSYENTIYVANSGDNTVSVIDVTNNTKIKDIPVGKGPKLGFNGFAGCYICSQFRGKHRFCN